MVASVRFALKQALAMEKNAEAEAVRSNVTTAGKKAEAVVPNVTTREKKEAVGAIAEETPHRCEVCGAETTLSCTCRKAHYCGKHVKSWMG